MWSHIQIFLAFLCNSFTGVAGAQFSFPLSPLNLQGVKLYRLNASVGSPNPQTFRLLLSIAHTRTWIPSAACPNCNFLQVPPYSHANSTSYSKDGRPFNDTDIVLVDNGEVPTSGVLSNDKVSLGQAVALDMKFGEVTDGRFIDFIEGFDGIFGLGMLHKGDEHDGSFLFAMKKAGLVERQIVGLHLGNGIGELTLGGVNETFFQPETLSYFPVVEKDAAFLPWRVATSGINVNGNALQSCKSSSVAFNTAAVYVMGPSEQISAIMTELGATNIFGFWVTNITQKFNITWTFPDPSGENKTDGSRLRSVTLTEKELLTRTQFGEQYGAFLFLNIEDSQLPSNEKSGWVFGTAFLAEKYYLTLDYDSMRVGIAQSAEKHEHANDSLSKSQSPRKADGNLTEAYNAVETAPRSAHAVYV